MTRRIVEISLLAMLLFGGFQAWTTGRERTKLQAEFDRLVKTTGDLPIGDPSKVHVLAIPTGEPLHFAWRIYLPPNYLLVVRDSSHQSISSNGKTSREFIARVRFLEEDGELKAFDSFDGGSYRNRVADKNLTDFLENRWDQISVEQVGSEGIEAIDPDDSATLLRLTIPEDLDAEARRTLKAPINSMIYSVEIGTPNPKKAKSKSPGKSKQ